MGCGASGSVKTGTPGLDTTASRSASLEAKTNEIGKETAPPKPLVIRADTYMSREDARERRHKAMREKQLRSTNNAQLYVFNDVVGGWGWHSGSSPSTVTAAESFLSMAISAQALIDQDRLSISTGWTPRSLETSRTTTPLGNAGLNIAKDSQDFDPGKISSRDGSVSPSSDNHHSPDADADKTRSATIGDETERTSSGEGRGAGGEVENDEISSKVVAPTGSDEGETAGQRKCVLDEAKVGRKSLDGDETNGCLSDTASTEECASGYGNNSEMEKDINKRIPGGSEMERNCVGDTAAGLVQGGSILNYAEGNVDDGSNKISPQSKRPVNDATSNKESTEVDKSNDQGLGAAISVEISKTEQITDNVIKDVEVDSRNCGILVDMVGPVPHGDKENRHSIEETEASGGHDGPIDVGPTEDNSSSNSTGQMPHGAMESKLENVTADCLEGNTSTSITNEKEKAISIGEQVSHENEHSEDKIGDTNEIENAIDYKNDENKHEDGAKEVINVSEDYSSISEDQTHTKEGDGGSADEGSLDHHLRDGEGIKVPVRAGEDESWEGSDEGVADMDGD